MKNNLPVGNIEKTFRAALAGGLIRNEDTSVIFHDLTFLEERIRHLKSIFPSSTLHGIAVKANPLLRILEFEKNLGTGVEAASLGELYLAEKAGFPADRIIFDSPVKTVSELEYALEKGMHINVDSLEELNRLSILRNSISSTGTAGLRINPQVGMGSILESSVAGDYSKFGVPLKSNRDALLAAFRKYGWLTGVHLHVGSQGCPLELLIRGIKGVYEFASYINNSLGHQQINILDIGGGLPVSYDPSRVPVSMEEYWNAIVQNIPEIPEGVEGNSRYHRKTSTEPGSPVPGLRLMTEFGRWVHVNAGWVASRVEYVKHEPGINTAMIHVGADLFLRECLNPRDWQHKYSVLGKNGILKKGNDPIPYNLGGPLCFSGDILAKQITLPEVHEGDYIIIHDSGGYTFSMWSRYNSRQTPRILGYYDDGKTFEVLKERETLESLSAFWT
jgi:diaminopimelate decarboxylase